MKNNEIREFAHLVEAAQSCEHKFKANPWFRGHPKAEYGLQPHVYRTSKLRAAERSIALEFQMKAPSRYANCPLNTEYFAWLSLMRHYGAPTRLLDWTESILVAAYFAVEGRAMTDSAIWALNPGKLNRKHPDYAGVLAATDDRVIAKAGLAFGIFSRFPPVAALAVGAQEIDVRMLVQHCAFTIHDSREPLEKRPATNDILCKFTIPCDARKGLRDSLECMRINSETMFPDLAALGEHLVTATWK